MRHPVDIDRALDVGRRELTEHPFLLGVVRDEVREFLRFEFVGFDPICAFGPLQPRGITGRAPHSPDS